eukprot:576077-Pyramimonas_sp.AAC.1
MCIRDRVSFRTNRNLTKLGGYSLAITRNWGHTGAGLLLSMVAGCKIQGQGVQMHRGSNRWGLKLVFLGKVGSARDPMQLNSLKVVSASAV